MPFGLIFHRAVNIHRMLNAIQLNQTKATATLVSVLKGLDI